MQIETAVKYQAPCTGTSRFGYCIMTFATFYTTVYFVNYSDQCATLQQKSNDELPFLSLTKNPIHFNNLFYHCLFFGNHSDHCAICAAIYSKQVMINFYPFPLQKKSHRLLQTIYHLNPNWQEGGHFPPLVLFGSGFVSWFFIKIFQTFL